MLDAVTSRVLVKLPLDGARGCMVWGEGLTDIGQGRTRVFRYGTSFFGLKKFCLALEHTRLSVCTSLSHPTPPQQGTTEQQGGGGENTM